MDYLLLGVVALGVVFFLLYYFFNEEARGRRKYGVVRWEQIKEERRRQEEEERRRREEAERLYREQDASLKKCPICRVTMDQKEVMGYTIDYCPEGHGIWLDQNELDCIIEDAESEGDSSGFTTGFIIGLAIN